MSVIRLRPTTPADEPFLLALYTSTRDDLAALPWDDSTRSALIGMQFQAQQRQYRSSYPAAEHQLVFVDEQPAGRFYVARQGAAITLIDISLLPAFRGRGIGGFLLNQLLDEARRSGRSVALHVETTNPARHLYERLGFVVIGNDGMYLAMEWYSPPEPELPSVRPGESAGTERATP